MYSHASSVCNEGEPAPKFTGFLEYLSYRTCQTLRNVTWSQGNGLDKFSKPLWPKSPVPFLPDKIQSGTTNRLERVCILWEMLSDSLATPLTYSCKDSFIHQTCIRNLLWSRHCDWGRDLLSWKEDDLKSWREKRRQAQLRTEGFRFGEILRRFMAVKEESATGREVSLAFKYMCFWELPVMGSLLGVRNIIVNKVPSLSSKH